MVSYIDDNVKNNSPKYFGRWLLSVGHGRWWLATRTTMQRTTLPSTSVGGYCRWVIVAGGYTDDNVKNNSPKYFGWCGGSYIDDNAKYNSPKLLR